MTETRLQELQNEITRLQQFDKALAEKVAAEFNEFIEVVCSLQLDMEMANESENIQ